MWTKPKTDWTSADVVNIEDYNRLRDNIYALKARTHVGDFEEIDSKSYTDYYYADDFNKFERNIDKINRDVYQQDIGATQTFYDNGAFISAEEMNRLESACVAIKSMLDNIDNNKRHIPFRLGAYKDIRI